MKPIITLGPETKRMCEVHSLVILPIMSGTAVHLMGRASEIIAKAKGCDAEDALANLELELINLQKVNQTIEDIKTHKECNECTITPNR